MSRTRKWGVTGLCLLLGLSSAPLAQAQDPSPTPLFAPDSLASVLPDEVGGAPLLAIGLPPGEMSVRFLSNVLVNPLFVNPLPALAREPSDVRLAVAITGDESVIMAIRVDGVPGDVVADELIESIDQAIRDTVEAAGATFPPGLVLTTRDIDGETVRVYRNADWLAGMVLYPIGEVAFLILARGETRDDEGPAAEVLAALRESVARARQRSLTPEPQRVEFADAGLAVTLPGDWRLAPEGFAALAPEGSGAEDDIGYFVSPDGFREFCIASRRSFDGRVTLAFILELVAREGLPSPTMARVQTAAGEAVRVTWSPPAQDTSFIEGLTSSATRYIVPWGDTIYSADCVIGHEESLPPDEDWLYIVETFEFLEQPSPQVSQEVVESARDLLCSIVVPIPGLLEETARVHRSMPRRGLVDVRKEVRRFFRRHEDLVKDFASPTTADTLAIFIDDFIAPSAWFSGRLRPGRVERQIGLVSRGGIVREARTRELITMFALAYGALDDPRIRADARRVAEAAYHFGATKRKRDPLKGWAYVNDQIDVELARHALEPCTPEADMVPTA